MSTYMHSKTVYQSEDGDIDPGMRKSSLPLLSTVGHENVHSSGLETASSPCGTARKVHAEIKRTKRFRTRAYIALDVQIVQWETDAEKGDSLAPSRDLLG